MRKLLVTGIVNLNNLLSGLLMLALLVAGGCDSGPKKSESPVPAETGAARQAVEQRRLCADNFRKVYESLRPTTDNVDAELQSALDLLNQWLSSCAAWEGEKLAEDLPLLGVSPVIPASELNRETASQIDVLYLRDQLLVRNMAEQVVQTLPNDQQKVQAIFRYVMRNVADDNVLIRPLLAIPDDQVKLKSARIVRSLQDICLTGRGNAQDRIWLLTTMLQQINLESGLLQTTPLTATATPVQIVAVPMQNQALLYDLEQGLQLPNLPEQTNTTDSIWKSWLQQMESQKAISPAALEKYQQQNWEQVSLLVPKSRLFVSPRMEEMQLELVGDQVCEVFRPTTGAGAVPGVASAVQTTLKKYLTNTSPVFWDYSDEMYFGLVNSTPEQKIVREVSMAALLNEVTSLRSSENQSEQKVYSQSKEKRLLMSRINFLTGDYVTAISTFMKLRLQKGIAGTSQEIQLQNLMRALQAEDAIYWSGLSQFEKGDFKSSRDTITNYLNRYQLGNWRPAAAELLFMTLLELGETAEAEKMAEHPDLSEAQKFRLTQILTPEK